MINLNQSLCYTVLCKRCFLFFIQTH